MVEQTATKLGRFVWHDMMSTDPPRSREFYEELLGWTVKEAPGAEGSGYPLIHAGGVPIGGIVQLPEDVPSHWVGYVAVEDLEGTLSAAQEAGGKSPVAATEIPDVGRFAVISHEGGSFLSPFQPARWEDCIPEAEPIPGRFCWNQLMSRDPESARTFYEKVFGWTTGEQELEGGAYWLFRSETSPAAGMMSSSDPGGHPDFWLAYVEVEDVDGCAARVTDLAGQILVPPTDIPGLARFCVTADPTGAILALSTHRAEPI